MLRRALDAARDGRGGVVLVEGEAGLGKSRLLDQVMSDASEAGITVRTATAHDLERDRPFGVVIDALGITPRASDQAVRDVAHLVETSLLPPASADEAGLPAVKFRIVDAFTDLVEHMALQAPLLLALEDLHWADAASLLVASRLLRGAGTLPLLLVASTRPPAQRADLASLVAAVEAVGGTHIGLGPLRDDAVEALAYERLGLRPGAGLLGHIRRAGGNPFYIVELLDALRRDELLEVAGDVVDVDGAVATPALTFALLRGMASLPAETVGVLRRAALLGSAFSADDLAVAMERPLREVVSLLEPAVRAGTLTSVDELAFRHDLMREAVAADIPPPLRRALHLDTARALAGAGRSAVTVATHFRLAGAGDREAVDWMRRAARETAARDPRVAADFLRSARDLAGVDHPESLEIAVDLVTVLSWSGDAVAGEALATDLLGANPPRALRNRIHSALSSIWLSLGKPDAIVSATTALLEDETTSGSERAQLFGRRARARIDTGDLDGAMADAAESRRLAREHGAPHGEDPGLFAICLVSGFRGDLADAIAAGECILRRDSDLPSDPYALPTWWAQTHVPLALAYLFADRLDDAAKALYEAQRTFSGTAFAFTATQYILALTHYLGGAWDDALAEAEAGLEVATETRVSLLQGVALGMIALVALHRDDVARADEVVADFERRSLSGPEIYFVPWFQALVAECHGDTDGACRLMGEAWSIATAVGAGTHCSLFCADHVRLQLASGHRDEAHEAAVFMDAVARRAPESASIRGAALRCRALADDDVGLILAAVEAYRGCTRPLELASTCEDAASMLAGREEGERAVALLQEASALWERLHARRDLRRIDAHLRRLGVRRGSSSRRKQEAVGWASVTTTEAKVADLVGEGLTNREIGARLFVSPRTVETHVAHLLQKLDVRSRREIAEIVRAQRAAST